MEKVEREKLAQIVGLATRGGLYVSRVEQDNGDIEYEVHAGKGSRLGPRQSGLIAMAIQRKTDADLFANAADAVESLLADSERCERLEVAMQEIIAVAGTVRMFLGEDIRKTARAALEVPDGE